MSDTETYLIEYTVYLTDETRIHTKMKVKNCMSDLHAKIKLEDYLKSKNQNFQKLNLYSKLVHE
jgi:hypothetical protein